MTPVSYKLVIPWRGVVFYTALVLICVLGWGLIILAAVKAVR